MPTEKTKDLLKLAGKQIATAKEALAETDRITRLRVMLEGEQEALLKTADPEDRAQMRQLGEIQAQLLVIPRRIEMTQQKQKDSVMPLVEMATRLETNIKELLSEEVSREADKVEKILLPHFRKTTDPKTGEVSNRARGIALNCDACNAAGIHAEWDTHLVIGDPCQFAAYPERAIPQCLRHLDNLMLILGTYLANEESFIPPGFRKGAE